MYLGPLDPTYSYSKAVEFSSHLYMSHYTIVVPVKQVQELWSFLHPFSYEVWIWLLVTLPSLIIAFWASKQNAEIDLETLLGFVIRAAVVDDGKYMHKIFNLKGNML